MKLLQFVTLAEALIFAAPAVAQAGDRVACNAPYYRCPAQQQRDERPPSEF